MSAAPGRTVRLERVDSTNEEAKRRAAAGDPGDLWIRADVQTAGRGRRGRAWTSEPGNLFCSALLRPGCSASEAAQLAFAAGLASAEAADAWVEAERVRLKWPNDLLIEGKKASGILLESGEDAKGRWLVVGIGVNLTSAPADVMWPATHLSACLKNGAQPPDPGAFFELLIAAFAHWRGRWASDGFAPLRQAWLARAHGLGGALTVRLPGETVEGVFEDLDGAGALVLGLGHGRRRAVSVGDVFFAGPRG